jgi:hypothetical protein
MKKIIRLTESDLTRIVKRVIKEQDEEWGQTDRGEEELQDLIEEARDILENELGYSIEEINSMDEMDMVDILSDEYDDLAMNIEELLNQEGFDTELDEGWDDNLTKRRYKDYHPSHFRNIPKNAVKPGLIDFEGTRVSKSEDDDDDFDEWSHGDDDEEFV